MGRSGRPGKSGKPGASGKRKKWKSGRPPERKERAVIAGNLAGPEKRVGPAAAGLPVPGPATMPVITMVDQRGRPGNWQIANMAACYARRTGCTAGSPGPHRPSRKSSGQTRPKTSRPRRRRRSEPISLIKAVRFIWLQLSVEPHG